jgi:hypothetical protein
MVDIVSGTSVASETAEWKNTRAKINEFAVVLKPFRMAGKLMKPGQTISPAEVLAMPRDNRFALRDNEFIRLVPMSAELTKG